MWICLNNAFLSIVSKGDDDNKLCVRARKRSHIAEIFPEVSSEIIESKDADYRFRVFIDRETVAKVIAVELKNISYDNFKNSVADKKLARAYGNIWAIMYDLQE